MFLLSAIILFCALTVIFMSHFCALYFLNAKLRRSKNTYRRNKISFALSVLVFCERKGKLFLCLFAYTATFSEKKPTNEKKTPSFSWAFFCFLLLFCVVTLHVSFRRFSLLFEKLAGVM